MNRIDEKFKLLDRRGKTAFMPFIVGGDPDIKTSLKIAQTLCETGDFLEIGVPYSDPLADGPTIQKADARALKSGANPDGLFRLIKALRKTCDRPITLLVYANMVFQRGITKFYKDAVKSGVDGIVIPDVPLEEAEDFLKASRAHNLKQIFLVSQTTGNERLKKILKYAEGYLYLVSVLGVTGARKKFGSQTRQFIKRVRKQTQLPLCVGFGISTPAQFRQMAKAGADGVIVGSAIVDIIAKNRDKKNLLPTLKKFIKLFSHT